MNEIVAERIFRLAESGDAVIARIFKPIQVDTWEWACRIEIQGLGEVIEHRIIGQDSFQALEGGLCILVADLERHEARLSHLDGEVGDLGLPLIISWDYGTSLRSLKDEMRNLIVARVREALTKGT